VKSYHTGGAYTEFEMPFLLKYAITKKFSVYGGVNIALTKLTGITESTYTKTGISRSVDTTFTTSTAMTTPPSISTIITYSGIPFQEYKSPLYTSQSESKLTTGYMIGFSYECYKKWLFDALIEQSPYKPNVVGGYNVNTPISSPYFRLSVGYRIY
jgi:hypothetical protein